MRRLFKIRILLLIFIGLGLAVCSSGRALAAFYYVSPNGNDGNAGTNTAPWFSFTRAMLALKPGDTLYLKDGIYNQSLNITVSGREGKLVTVTAIDEGKAIVSTKYPANALRIQNQAYIEVDGINFRNSGQYDPDALCATNGQNYSGVDGLRIYHDDHITLRRVIANGSSGCNSAVISLAAVRNSLLEDCAASGQGRVVLNLLDCSAITVRRCWLNWTGPSTGGGTVPSVSQIYDSGKVLFENNIGVNYTSTNTDFLGTWAHYKSTGDNTVIGSIVYMQKATNVGGIRDDAGCGHVSSGTVFSDNVSILTGAGGNGGDSINADPDNGSVFRNNTIVGSGSGAGTGIYLGYISDCPAQPARVKNVYNNSFVNFGRGIAANSSGTNYLQAHDYNNFYNTGTCLYNTGFMTPAGINKHEKCNTLNPLYDTARYGKGAYMMIPSALKGKGQDGRNIGASVLYRYRDGKLTNEPLWPWLMEERINDEFGISATWESKGGFWKSLTGIYSSYTHR